MSVGREKRVGPRALLFCQRTARLLQRTIQHLPPPCRIEEGNSNRMLHESRNARCRSGRDKRANFFKLSVLKRDGDLRGGHTKDHTIQKAPIERGLKGTPALLDVTAVGLADIERGRRRGADLNARDLLQGRLGPVYEWQSGTHLGLVEPDAKFFKKGSLLLFMTAG